MRRPSALSLSLVAAAAAAAGCNTGFEPQYRVTDLRILAVRAEVVGSTSADAWLGDAVQLSALVINPQGRAPVLASWYACAPQTVSPCVDEQVLKDPARLAELAAQPGSGVLLVGQGAAPAPIPVVDTGDLGVSAALDALVALAQSRPTFQCSLYVEIPVVLVVEAEGLREVAVKGVRITPPQSAIPPESGVVQRYVLNRNPQIGQIFRSPPAEARCSDGIPLTSDPYPTGLTVLCATAGDAPQEYEVCDAAGNPIPPPAAETRSWQWFVTAGEFPEFEGVGNAVDGAPEFERPPGPFTLWLVLRDGRGGVSWTRRDVAAAP